MINRINSKEAICHLVLSRESEGHIDFEQKFKKLLLQDLNLLKQKCNLPNERVYQCFENPKTKQFRRNILVKKLYNKYFCKDNDCWAKGYLNDFASEYFNKKEVLLISTDYKNPNIIVIKLKDEDKYNILDGMHRSIAYIKNKKSIINAIVIEVVEDIGS